MLEPQLLRGAALTLQGALEDAEVCLREKLADRASAIRLRCFGLARLADTLILQGKYDEALATVEEGLGIEEETGNRQFDAELHRLMGLTLSGLKRLEESEAALQDAIASLEGNRQKLMSCAPR